MLAAIIILISGKKDGRGGIEALDIKISPSPKIKGLKLISSLSRLPIRENELWLEAPLIKNIPIEAQPWAKDIIITLRKMIFLKDIKPSIIKVMCVTLL